ncbi:hypothetical protein N0V93_001615 [Gnomoniopsis smithogilvyi]|uniref:LITAF domain-containing protein n=1 Tax=Gnomoniopsis smithogilvyi TaxID=1191159 RepID=A0A9W8Z2E1_9PEZI|nr:hypothetical protein N0V93_001615 [Gnomoniopsis smithogilvyi]
MSQTSEPQHEGVVTVEKALSSESNGTDLIIGQESDPPSRQDIKAAQAESTQALPDDLIQVVEVPSYHESVITSPPAQEKPMIDMIKPEPPPQMVTPLAQLTDQPAHIDCPYCQQRSLTYVMKEGSSMQTMAAAVCCLFCGVITVCIPMLCHWFEDTTIFCSKCRKMVAKIPHDGTIQVNHMAGPPLVPSNFPGNV